MHTSQIQVKLPERSLCTEILHVQLNNSSGITHAMRDGDLSMLLFMDEEENPPAQQNF